MVSARLSRERQSVRTPMAMGSERPKPLHNFTFPCLKWENRRLLRCVKPNSPPVGDDPAPPRFEPASKPAKADVAKERGALELEKPLKKLIIIRPRMDGEIDRDNTAIREAREKEAIDQRGEKRKRSDGEVFKEREESGAAAAAQYKEDESGVAAVEAVRPWNLRTRRSTCKAPIEGAGAGEKTSASPMRNEVDNEGGGSCSGLKKAEDRAKFSVSLTRTEVEEDFMRMVGHRPPRRPKKRSKNVQRELDVLFPGLWLTEVTADAYRVPEAPENPQK